MNNTRLPDTELANTIRKLQNEVDEKILILETLRKQYHGNETIEWGKYIHSVAWEEMRQKVLRRDGFKCVCCGESKNLSVHHTTYENLGAEKMSDLVTLCQKCHEKVHNGEEIPKKKSGSTVRLGVPYGFKNEEWELILYWETLASCDYISKIDEDFWLKPEYFESFLARQTVIELIMGAFPSDLKIAEALEKATETLRTKNLAFEVLRDMYYSLLLKAFISLFNYKEAECISFHQCVCQEGCEEVDLEIIQLKDLEKRLREELGEM